MSIALIVATMLGGTPVPEVTSAALVQEHLGQQVNVVGVLERVALEKGRKRWLGTALVLDDDTTVYVTYAEPPAGWAPLVGARVVVAGLLSPSIDDHSQSLLAPHLRAPSTPKRDATPPARLLGKRVRLAGLARDAGGGAVLLVNAEPISVAGLEAWPGAAAGKAVIAWGTLAAKQLPEARRDAKGAITVGTQLVLEGPQWRLASEPTP